MRLLDTDIITVQSHKCSGRGTYKWSQHGVSETGEVTAFWRRWLERGVKRCVEGGPDKVEKIIPDRVHNWGLEVGSAL